MRPLLIVVDMQNDFVSGSLGTKEAQEIVGGIQEKIRQYMQQGYDMIFTRDTHGEEYLETMEGKHLPVVHCVKNTWGWNIVDALCVPKEAVIFDKPVFGSIALGDYVKEQGYQEIEFVGVCTDICVVTNALLLKTMVNEAAICVDASCCAGVTKESHEAALTTMRMCQIRVI